MTEITRGNLLQAKVDALVNTVNTVGVMGKGIALQFQRAFPDNYKVYKKACDDDQFHVGSVLTVEVGGVTKPRYVINFPTKKHWRSPSKLEYIETGLDALVREVRQLGIKSIALPPLGCGNGGLNWADVLPRIQRAFDQLPDVHALIYEPAGAPQPEEMLNRTKRPSMSKGRAAVLALMNRYQVPGYDYRTSLLEVQKLAYFMQEAGEELRLKYVEAPYGPYADELRFVLRHIEGHFITGFGDGRNKPETPLQLLPDAAKEAERFLLNESATQERFQRVATLIEGFETPFGMELLASVHWVARQNPKAAATVQVAIEDVHKWSERKKKIMIPAQIEAAWYRLKNQRWI